METIQNHIETMLRDTNSLFFDKYLQIVKVKSPLNIYWNFYQKLLEEEPYIELKVSNLSKLVEDEMKGQGSFLQVFYEYIKTEENQEKLFEKLKLFYGEIAVNGSAESKKFLEYVFNKTTILRKYPTFFSKEEDLSLVYGAVQSGKSRLIQFRAIYNFLFRNITTIIVVRNLLNDSQQLYDGFLNIIKELEEFDIDENDIFVNTKQKFNKIIIKKPKIIIALANSSQVKELCYQVHRTFRKKKLGIELIVDEADVLAYANKDKTELPYIKNFFELKDKCASSLYITATPYNSLFKELGMTNRDMYIMEPKSCYKDYMSIDYIETDFNFKNIENTREFYRQFNEKEVHLVKNETVIHPNIFLHTTASRINEQNSIFESFKHKDFEDWDVIIYNGTDKKLYSCWADEMKSQFIKSVNGNQIIFKDKATIRDILQTIKNLDNLRDIHNILILAGRMADRGTNFVSRDYEWHLTHQILDIKTNSDCVTVTQHMRILGNYEDAIPLKLYSSAKNIEIIQKSFKTQDKILRQIVEEKNEVKIRSMLSALELYKEDMPKLKLTKRVLYKNLLNVKVRENKGDEEWGIANLLKNVEKHIMKNESTIVLKILYYLWNGKDFEAKTKEQIIENCGIKHWLHYISWSKKQSAYKLLEKEGTNWNINNNIKKDLITLII